MIKIKTEIYVNKIIEGTGLNRQEIKDLVEEKKQELKGLISEEGALFIIAKELGVDLKDENKEFMKEIEINISDIKTNMKNITIFGRIKEIYRTFDFNKNDGSTGSVGSFLLHDNTGDIRIVLWDNNIKIFEDPNFEINQIVKIINGIAKESKFGGLEIHIGNFGKLLLSPDDVDYKKYPKIEKEFIKINDINLTIPSISLEGKIIQLFQLNVFTRKDGKEGKVRSLNLMDSTGTIRITFWNDETEKLNDLEVDDIISITTLNPRQSNLDPKSIELYANRNSIVKKIEKKIKFEADFIEKIATLQTVKGLVSFQGILTTLENLKTVTLKSGENVSLLSFVVSDESDAIRITLWRDNAEKYSKLFKIGDGVSFKDVMIKYSNFSNRNEVSFLKDSDLKIIKLDIKDLKDIETSSNLTNSTPKFQKKYTKISEINSNNIFEVKGFIAKIFNNIRFYEACSQCRRKIDNCQCDIQGVPEQKMILNLIIDDETGTIKTTFFGEKAEKIIGEKAETIANLKETPDFDKYLEEKSAEILGKDLIIKGKAKYNDFSNNYEISVFDYLDVNINEELDNIMKTIES